MAQVGRVAAEQLVCSLPRQYDLHVLPCRLGEEVGRQDRRVADRLGEPAGDRGEGALQRRLVRGDDMMVGADVVRHRFGVRTLVVPGLEEAHGIRVDLRAGHHAGGTGREQR